MLKDDYRCQLLGWVLFLACSIFYMISNIVAGDMFSFVGSLLFFCACIVFMLPLVRERKKK